MTPFIPQSTICRTSSGRHFWIDAKDSKGKQTNVRHRKQKTAQICDNVVQPFGQEWSHDKTQKMDESDKIDK